MFRVYHQNSSPASSNGPNINSIFKSNKRKKIHFDPSQELNEENHIFREKHKQYTNFYLFNKKKRSDFQRHPIFLSEDESDNGLENGLISRCNYYRYCNIEKCNIFFSLLGTILSVCQVTSFVKSK